MLKKHGLTKRGSKTREYHIWVEMRQRCSNSNHPKFHRYGERGIAVCERWGDLVLFLADMGPRPDGTSLDRIENDGNYEPGNCRWATARVQRLNQERVRRVVCSDGRVFGSIIEAAEETGSNRSCISDVLHGRQETHRGFTWRYA